MSELAHPTDPNDGSTWTPEMDERFDVLVDGVMTTGQARETVLREFGRKPSTPAKTVTQTEPPRVTEPSFKENRYIAPENMVPGDDPPESAMVRTPRDFSPIKESPEDRAARQQANRDFHSGSV